MRAIDGLDLSGQRAVNAADPTVASDLATRGYTDTVTAARMRYAGAWSSSSGYALNDVVVSGGSAYVCIRAVAAAAATSFVTSGTFASSTGAATTMPLPVAAASGDTLVLGFSVTTNSVTRVTPITNATLISPALNYGNNTVFAWVYSYTVTAADVAAGTVSMVSQAPNTGYALTYHVFRNLGAAGANAGTTNYPAGTATVTPTSFPSWIYTIAFANTLATSSVASQANQIALQPAFLSAKITAASGYEVLAAGTSTSRIYTLTNNNGTGAALSVALATTSGVNTAPALDSADWALLADQVPPGSMQMYGGAAAPSGYLLCDGASYLRSDYPALFAALGTAYGSVDASHFTVPDLRGRVPFGKAASTFTTLGQIGGALTHSHTLSDLGQAAIALVAATASIVERRITTASWTSSHTISTTTAAGAAVAETVGAALMGSTDAASTLPPYQVVNYIIKT